MLDKFVDAALADTATCDQPRYSRKRKRVIIPVEEFDVSIPLKQLDAAIEIAEFLSDGVGVLQTLLDGLLHARQKYGRTKPLRGKHHGKEDILYTQKYAAAWGYVVLKKQMAKPPEDVVKAAKRELNAFYRKSKKPRPRRSFDERVYVTALLVERAFGSGARFEGKFIPQNWYRTYVKPYISNVLRIVRKKPLILDRNNRGRFRIGYLTKLFS